MYLTSVHGTRGSGQEARHRTYLVCLWLVRQSWPGGLLRFWKVLFRALAEDGRSRNSLLGGKLSPHSPCLILQMVPLRTSKVHSTQKPQQLPVCLLWALCALVVSQASVVCGFWLAKGRLLHSPPFPCEAPLLQPLQGGDFCLCILALSSIPGSGAIRRARPGPSHKSAGLI